MEDVDDGDGDGDGDGDAEADEDEGEGEAEGDNEEEDDQEEEDGEPGSVANPTTPRPSSSYGSIPLRPSVRPEALTASTYDIVPTIASPHSTSINTLASTPDMRWVFTGGTDGYIRKINWIDTANSKLMLTVAQRHPFVDSVVKAGVVHGYWENEETGTGLRTPPSRNLDDPLDISPVYSLAVQSQALWVMSGTKAGAINLYSVRIAEGTRITHLRKHTSAVSVLVLSQDERSALSGSWDKTILDWDLDAGKVKRSFNASGMQISSIEQRPLSSLPVPEESNDLPVMNGTFSSNNAAKPLANGVNGSLPNGVDRRSSKQADAAGEDAPGSPSDSLFGSSADKDSLFGGDGDGDGGMAAFGGDDDDELSRAIAQDEVAQAMEARADVEMLDAGGPVQPLDASNAAVPPSENANAVVSNGLPHAEEISSHTASSATLPSESTATSESTFMSASFDGVIRIWDRRQSNPIATIKPKFGVPPWCTGTCWSPDGNFIYAGRRNGVVEEFSLHKGLREPTRTFKFPNGSGAVTAVRAMPNGKHLVW